ncbi:MAG: lysylphosphatidylglycerol synthase transmembrane domain-containing protein [Flavobacteriaceae bacterium]|nr:lysylphosphatidylglycerol synthase transmembrane domain-containing protein [Flavobacteriaceae bacterium]
MNKSLITFLKIGIPLGLGMFLIYYSYSKFTPQQLEEISAYFKKTDYTFVILSVVFNLLSHISRAYRWNFLLEPLGYKPRLLNNFMAVSVAYIMNIFIPKSGEVSRALIINKYEDVPFDKAFGTIISERVVDLIFLFGFTTIALLLQFDKLSEFLLNVLPNHIIYNLIAVLSVFLVLFLLALKFFKSSIIKKIIRFFSGLKDGILSILKMKKNGSFIVHSFLIWGLYLLSFYTATFALNETSNIAFSTLIITFVVGSFSFAFTNSGFGSYPFFVAGILVIFSIPETVGTAFGWIVWASSIASIVFFGGLSLIILPFYNKEK